MENEAECGLGLEECALTLGADLFRETWKRMRGLCRVAHRSQDQKMGSQHTSTVSKSSRNGLTRSVIL